MAIYRYLPETIFAALSDYPLFQFLDMRPTEADEVDREACLSLIATSASCNKYLTEASGITRIDEASMHRTEWATEPIPSIGLVTF